MNLLQSQLISQFVAANFYWLFLGILVLNLTQRKHQKTSHRKRTATLYLAIAALILYATAQLALQYQAGDVYVVLVALLTAALIYRYRDHAFPFKLRCVISGKRLDMHSILYRDSNTLPQYDQRETDDDADEDEQTIDEPDEER